MDQDPPITPKKRKKIFGIRGKIGLILLAILVYFTQQTLIRVSQENISKRRVAECKKTGAPIKLAFVYPEQYREQFLAGAELAVDLANAAARTNTLYRPVIWEFFPETSETALDVATKISKNTSYFGAVGYCYSQTTMEASTVFEQNKVITIISSANSSRMMALEFDCVFFTAHSTEKTGKQVLPALSKILPKERFAEGQPPIRLAIIQTPTIFSEDMAISLYADISRNNAVFNFIATCKKYPTLSLKQLLENEIISHHQYNIVTKELNQRAAQTNEQTPELAIEIAQLIREEVIPVDPILDITYTTVNAPPFAIATELAAIKPDVIFFATETTTLPLIRQLRRLKENVPIIAIAGFDNPTELKPYEEYLSNFYVISSYNDNIQGKALIEVAQQAATIYPSKYNKFEPDHVKAEAYQAVALLIQACRIFPEYYPQSIASTLRYAHPDGWNVLNQTLTVSRNNNFDNNLPMYLKKYENGRLVDVLTEQEK